MHYFVDKHSFYLKKNHGVKALITLIQNNSFEKENMRKYIIIF